MNQYLGQISLVVKDYDEAIHYYTQVLKFELLEDTQLSPEKRWVVVKPKGSKNGCNILLAKASNEKQLEYVGNQTGGRVFLFLYTDNFMRDYEDYQSKGVEFMRPVSKEPYGTVSVFRDLYGNLWDLIEPISTLR
ncbi:MAG: hypothetical protein RL634_921 [Bacteroidota bacterium]|jgi:uncharacterized glyoxalase superfamily protein PhnB